GAKGGDAALVIVLHARMARSCRADQIIADDEIGRRAEVTDGKYAERAGRECSHPRTHGHMSHLVAAGEDKHVLCLAPAKYAILFAPRHLKSPGDRFCSALRCSGITHC